MSDALSQLEEWYRRQCDGKWEHQHSVTINTLGKPGWHLQADLAGTTAGATEFEELDHELSNSIWLHCRVVDGKFEGTCDPLNLEKLIEIFLSWADATYEPASSKPN